MEPTRFIKRLLTPPYSVHKRAKKVIQTYMALLSANRRRNADLSSSSAVMEPWITDSSRDFIASRSGQIHHRENSSRAN